MPAATTCRNYPYPLGGDPPTLAAYFAALATAIDADVCTIAAQLADAEGVIDGFTAADTYNPVLTASTTPPELGTTGTSAGRYVRIGAYVFFEFVITFGGTGITQGSGTYLIPVPLTPAALAGSGAIHRGFVTINDASVGFRDWKAVIATDGIRIRALNSSYAAQPDATNANIGLTFAAGDQITGHVIYLTSDP